MIIQSQKQVFDRRVMNQEKSTALSGYDVSTEEVQSLIMKWAKATEAFHYRYAKLDKAITSLQKTARRHSTTNRTQLRRLLELRQYSTDVLMTLLLDMSGQRPERSAQPSKPGQLHSHACLLDELNRKIDAELISITTVAQA
ncbi:hypothetical protein [Spirosoma validum]|nr:hypothetical protein [Spirosoma validum]